MQVLDPATNQKAPASLWRTVAGWALIGVGVAGLVLPIIPGIPLLVAGLIALSAQYKWASRCLAWLKQQKKWFSGAKAE